MRPLFVVEDDALARAALVRHLRSYHEVASANDVDGALALLAMQEPSGVLADLALEDLALGGLEVLRAARVMFPGVPVAIVTGSTASSAINAATAIGAAHLAKPYAESALLPFLDLVAAREAGVGHVGHAISTAATLWGLTFRQRQLLPWLVARLGPDEICKLAGYERATYKNHVAALLEKSGCANTAEVVIEILLMAVEAARREQ